MSKVAFEVKGTITEQAEAMIAMMEELNRRGIKWDMYAFNYPLNKELCRLRPDLWHHMTSVERGAKAWTRA